MKKLVSLVLALCLVLASCAVAFAEDPATPAASAPTGKIVITNAPKGIEYKVYKLFDATTDGNGAVAYTGTIPSSLTDYFKYVENSGDQYVTEKDGTRVSPDKLSDDAVAALKTWAGTETAVATASGTGTKVEFPNLGYGYYVITSSQGDKKITVVTLKGATANIVDKNETTVIPSKKVNDKDVYVGETVTYTLEVATTNYMGDGENAKQVVKYVIKDKTPPYLSNVAVQSVTIATDPVTSITPVPQFDANGEIEVEWATGTHGNYTSKYDNGVKITVVYTAKVNNLIYVGDANPNRNVLEVIPYVDDGDEPGPWDEHFYDDEEIFTYGAAIYKMDENGYPLTGAKFAVKGLTVTGENGKYTVSDFDATSDTYSADLDVDSEGYLYILGLASDVNLTVKETKAPDGYNLVVTPMTLTPIKMSQTVSYTSRDIYYDAKGKVIYDSGYVGGSSTTITANEGTLKTEANVLKVENKKGTELPSTGGIGTTIFYILGGLLVVGAAVILVARRRVKE